MVARNWLTNYFLNLHIKKFKHLNISAPECKPTKNSLSLLSEFYTTSLYASDIGADSFEHFQLGNLNLGKDKYLKIRRNTF